MVSRGNKNYNLKISNISLIIFVFLAAIMINYTVTQKVNYLSFVILCIVIFMMMIKSNKWAIKKIDKYFLFILIGSFCYLTISALMNYEVKYFIKVYLIMYLVIFYLYLSFMKFGVKYAEKVFKQFTFLLNSFSVLNLYQVIFHKPILLNFLTADLQLFQTNLYTPSYRTISVFGHPIVAGLFFVITFLCNIYVIKSPFKFILQGILLINIYSTLSRSAWLAFAIVMVIFALIHIKRFKLPSNVRLTYKKVFYIYIYIIFLVFGLCFIALNFESIFDTIIHRFGDSLSRNSSDISNLQRTGTVIAMFNYMANSDLITLFFGNGLNSATDFMLSHTIVIPYFTTTDNQYLTWYYELGIVGIVGYLATIIYLFLKLLKKNNYWIQELSLLCLVVISVEIIFFEGIEWKDVAIMFTFIIACLSFNFDLPDTNTKIK